MSRHAVITGTGRYLPATADHQRRPARALRAPAGVRRQDGGQHRHQGALAARETWATSDLAVEAAKRALAQGRQAPRGRGPDHPRHRLARLHHARRPRSSCSTSSARRTPAPSTSAAPARRFPPGSPPRRASSRPTRRSTTVLVIGVYMMSRLADPPTPRSSSTATARAPRCVEASERPGFLGTAFQADGAYYKHWGIYLERHRRARQRGIGDARAARR